MGECQEFKRCSVFILKLILKSVEIVKNDDNAMMTIISQLVVKSNICLTHYQCLVTDDFHEDSSYKYQHPGAPPYAGGGGGGGGGDDLTRGPLLTDLVHHQGGPPGNFNQIR